MATRKLTFPYVLVQNTNDDSTAYGKYFAFPYNLQNTLSLKGLCSRLAAENSCFTTEIASGVIDRITQTMIELIMSGVSVKWDGLGTFRPTVESKGKANPLGYDINTDVKGIHVRFVPENAKGEEITSRKFLDLVTFSFVGVKKIEKTTGTTQGGNPKIIYSNAVKKVPKTTQIVSIGNWPYRGAISSADANSNPCKFAGESKDVHVYLKKGDFTEEALTLTIGTATAQIASPSEGSNSVNITLPAAGTYEVKLTGASTNISFGYIKLENPE